MAEFSEHKFELISPWNPGGDQPQAIQQLLEGVRGQERHQVLLGVTGSGKTFTMANVIHHLQRPTLVLVHNKTLAAQLYSEFKQLFPNNAVGYFVSYYDYYQPEAYLPVTDTYIDKDAKINDEIDRMRHYATYALLTRPDVIIVSSVSCIYGIGAAESYYNMLVKVAVGDNLERSDFLKSLVEAQYERNDYDFYRGKFRVRGDVVEIFPAYQNSKAIRVEFFGDEVDSIKEFDPLTGQVICARNREAIFPNSHYVSDQVTRQEAIESIRQELTLRLQELEKQGKLLERQRLEQRTMYDLEMMEELGFCSGIENYSRHFSGRNPGEPPPTLVDYFPEDFLLFIDESHVTVPQIGAMYYGDRSRKKNLIDFGFRLPSALDNRPLKFDEFQQVKSYLIYVSATPGDYELEKCQGVVVEQIVRPTGLIDPQLHIQPVAGQVDDLMSELVAESKQGKRVLVTTLTKRMAEDLTDYYCELGIRAKYLHSDIGTVERVELISALRRGEFDVLIGINLLREGLDIPEVSLVAILDADKEGFLRSARSLVQTFGRAARNVDGRVILYADRITGSMQKAIDETERRRSIQEQYNREHHIEPKTIVKPIRDLSQEFGQKKSSSPSLREKPTDYGKNAYPKKIDLSSLPAAIKELEDKMFAAAEKLEFEEAAKFRDEIFQLKQLELEIG